MPESPHLAGIHLHPIKSLGGITVPECRIGPAGGLEADRVWALFAEDGTWINGKRTPAIHRIRATYAPDLQVVSLAVAGGGHHLDPASFAFPGDTAGAAAWFSRYFGEPVTVRYAAGGFPDDAERNGPLVISTGTLEAVAEWFPGIDLPEARRRFRAPLEIGGVVPFWEDQLYDALESNPVAFRVGAVRLEGINPCPRCPVPGRDSQTGADLSGFQKRFTELRRTHYPAWARQPVRIRHYYHLGVNTRLEPTEFGKVVRVGDPVQSSRTVPQG